MKRSKYIAVAVILLTVFSCKSQAQKSPDRQASNFKTNTAELQRLKKVFKSKQVPEEDLKRRAEKLGIPYRIENKDGSVQQLSGFDSKDRPIYRMTNARQQHKIDPCTDIQKAAQEEK